jgi:peptidoglycan/LPS O-acetylase OafA/YrhL
MYYRREIDGLRALAVVPVLLFHAGFEAFSGGYVGVDIFFVISGYLITTIILSELEQGKFSIINFYERRARRILPALFLVMIVCIPFAWLWLLPDDMKDFSKSLVAVSVFASNIFFWHDSGYFDTAAELKPLLHTWSLAVEEQYYVFFPLFLMSAWRFGKRFIITILVFVAVASLLVAQWGSIARPTAAFYLLPTRGWELLIGAFAAFQLSKVGRVDFNKNLSEIGAGTGLALILYSVFSYSKVTPFPGLYALVPTLGTFLIIIFATQQTLIGRVVGNNVFVSIGLISYSAYLWHLPLFVFARHRSLTEPSKVVFAMLILASLALAYLSWKYIETPFRSKQKVTKKYVFSFAILGSVFFCVYGMTGYYNNGYDFRFSHTVNSLAKTVDGGMDACDWDVSHEPCYLGSKSQAPFLAIVGDSHTNVLRKAFSESFGKLGVSALSYGMGWCVPLLDVGTNNPAKNPRCRSFIDNSFKKIMADDRIKYVVLHAEWTNYSKGYRWRDTGVAFYSDGFTKTTSLEENKNVLARGLRRTIDLLHKSGKQVIIVKSVPEYEVRVPDFLAKNFFINGEISLANFVIDGHKYALRNSEIEDLFEKIPAQSDLQFVDPLAIFCSTGTCRYIDGEQVLYADSDHLSYYGARILVDKIVEKLVPH